MKFFKSICSICVPSTFKFFINCFTILFIYWNMLYNFSFIFSRLPGCFPKDCLYFNKPSEKSEIEICHTGFPKWHTGKLARSRWACRWRRKARSRPLNRYPDRLIRISRNCPLSWHGS